MILSARQRRVVDEAIRNTCAFYDWHLFALNVRTNHVHAVVAAPVSATRVVVSLKACATRQMRLADCWLSPSTPWSHGASKRYLWSATQLERAIVYVLNGQGDPLD